MRKQRQFCPSAQDKLEERVVMSGVGVGGTAAAAATVQLQQFDDGFHVPTLTRRTLDRALERVDRAFDRFAGDYNRAWRAAVRASHHIGPDEAAFRLSDFALRRGDRLARDLFHAPAGIPFAGETISPTLELIGLITAEDVASAPTLQDAQFVGRDFIFPGKEFARETLLDSVRFDLESGLYRFRG